MLKAVPAAIGTVGTLTLLRLANVLAPTATKDAPRTRPKQSRTPLQLAVSPTRVFTYAVSPVCAAITVPPLLPCKPPSSHPRFCPQASIVALPPARFSGRRLLPFLNMLA